MSIRAGLWCALTGAATMTLLLHAPAAADVVAAQEYRFKISHAELPASARNGEEKGIPLKLNIANQGARDLYDVRIFLAQVGARTLADFQKPARVRSLAAGSESSLTWTFDSLQEPDHASAGPQQQRLVFRVEAVDRTTQRIVKFYQTSTRSR